MTLNSFVSACVLSILFCSCSEPENYDQANIQKASIQIYEVQKEVKVVHYDYDKSGKRLVRKFEIVNESNPDILKIAIQNFLAKTNFRGHYKQLNFEHSVYQSDLITFYFKGNYDFKRNADEEIFKKALELTIANYIDNTNINLVFNDNKF